MMRSKLRLIRERPHCKCLEILTETEKDSFRFDTFVS